MALMQVITHISSLPFADSSVVLEHLNSHDLVHPTLAAFLQLNKVSILHCDKSYKSALKPLQIEYKESTNIMRAIKKHISTIIKSKLNEQLLLSVSHLYSKDKLQYDMQREDNFVVIVGYEIDQVEKELEALNMRMEKMIDWYIPHFKVLVKNNDYNQVIHSILGQYLPHNSSDDPAINQDNCSLLKDTSIEYKINDISNEPVGDLIKEYDGILREMISDVSENDRSNLRNLNNLILEKKSLLSELESYLEEKMKLVAPNLRHILGDRLTSKLIHKAGGLMNLSLAPSSTLQLFGAEKSLFKALKQNKRTPKHGILYNLDYIKDNKARMCRFVANKCSIAARIDCFNKDRTDQYGLAMRRQIDRKIRIPKKDYKVETTSKLLERVHSKISDKSQNEQENENGGNFSGNQSENKPITMSPRNSKTPTKNTETKADKKTIVASKAKASKKIEEKKTLPKESDKVKPKAGTKNEELVAMGAPKRRPKNGLEGTAVEAAPAKKQKATASEDMPTKRQKKEEAINEKDAPKKKTKQVEVINEKAILKKKATQQDNYEEVAKKTAKKQKASATEEKPKKAVKKSIQVEQKEKATENKAEVNSSKAKAAKKTTKK
jgi:nucleolar protein 56